MNSPAKKYQVALIYCGLIAATWLVFSHSYTFDFISIDDDQFVTENSYVQAPFTRDSLYWAFTMRNRNTWHPITWLSHMLDYRLFGLNAGAHHLMSVLIHTISTVLLFEILRRMGRKRGSEEVRKRGSEEEMPHGLKTSQPHSLTASQPHSLTASHEEPLWRSAAVALLFSIHPLHVQTVAWVALRKDVLSTCFEFGALLAYVTYTAKPSAARFLPALALFALALMSKSMVITLPALLLLLDYWPLQRYAGRLRNAECGMRNETAAQANSAFHIPHFAFHRPQYSWPRLVFEKIPFFALSAALSIFVMGNKTPQIVSLAYRLANVPVAYVGYLQQTFWPTGLAMFYLHPGDTLPLWKSAVCTVLLALATLAAIALRRRKPYIFLGWFWYIGMLLPVCGIMQISTQGSADHYTYVPLVGIFIIVAWAVADLKSQISNLKPQQDPESSLKSQISNLKSQIATALLLASGAALIALTAVGYHQAGYWKNGLALFTQAVKISPNSGRMHVSVANELFPAGKIEEAAKHFQEAIRIETNDPVEDAYNNLGLALTALGRANEAIPYYQRAIEIAPNYADAYFNLAVALAQQKRFDEAILLLRRVIAGQRGAKDAQDLLGKTLLAFAEHLVEKGDREKAITQYREALQINPAYAPAWNNLGTVLNDLGRTDEASKCYEKALQLDTRYAKAHANLAQLLAARGDLDAAARHYQDALQADPAYANARLGLVKTLVLLQRPQEALACFKKWATWERRAPARQPDFAQLGAFLEEANEPQAATALYENLLSGGARAAGLKDTPNDLALRMNLARSYVAQNRIPDAVAQYQEVIKADPANADAYFNLAALMEALGKTEEARQYLLKTLELNPADQAAQERLKRLGGNPP